MHPMWWMWGAGGLVLMLVVLAFWGVLIAGIVVAIRWFLAQGQEARSDTALQILRERYARGELSLEEFEARKRDLTA
jgi:putative membrane protein